MKGQNKTPSFTFDSYERLITTAKISGYCLCPVEGYETEKPVVVLRHDVDVSIEKAKSISYIEEKIGVKSTYFFLVGSEMYNLCSDTGVNTIRTLMSAGHEIGLHFDASCCKSEEEFKKMFLLHRSILSDIAGEEIKSVSWHIPSKNLLGKDFAWIKDLGVINTYSNMFYLDFVYCSDSCMRWRDNPYDYFIPEKYKRIQLLTHPVWYGENGDKKRIIDFYSKKKSKNILDAFSLILN